VGFKLAFEYTDRMQPLVNAQWLLEHISDPNVRVVDTRFLLGKPEAGLEAYNTGHIPGAVFVDLERDLSNPVRPDRIGGRHPLPDVDALTEKLSSLGVGSSHVVVAYDDPSSGQGFYAAHLWWLMRYLGHDNVTVLDGGLPKWLEAGGALETATPQHPRAEFTASVRPDMIVNAEHVAARGENTILIDSRAPERYRGEVEPLDWKAGHIPGAINRNWAEGIANGVWKDAQAQRKRFEDANLEQADEVLLYCGSGVSATGNVLALEIAGIKGAKLYAGSWSDWVSDDSRPVERS
jgi:thiosulfate/3-mercaptopyruvate sulfurtransferase